MSLDLPDEEFIEVFERAGFDRTDFPHRAHLRMAWLYVRHLGVERAIDRATAGIRAMAARHGQTNLYHDTLTRAWVYLVAAAVAEPPEVGGFDEYLRRHPELLDKGCLLRYYSKERLSSPTARARWLAPDLHPIPGAPESSPSSAEAERVIPVPADEFRQTLQQVPLPVAVMTARDATRFADPARAEGVGQFRGVPHTPGRFGAPIITGGPAWFECRLGEELAVANHQVICGTVVAEGATAAPPLHRLRGEWL